MEMYKKGLTFMLLLMIGLVAGCIGAKEKAAAPTTPAIHATGEIVTIIPCYAPDVDCMFEHKFGDELMKTRNQYSVFTGTMEGTGTGVNSQLLNLKTGKQFNSAYGHFVGTVGDSEPGSFARFWTWTVDIPALRGEEGNYTWEGYHWVIEGTGMGGLEGICGGGTFEGYGTPELGFTTTYDFEYRFGEACKE